MSEPYLSEIRLMSFDFAPSGWALCNGQILPISQNQALFSLLGTTYGGDGQTSFALPDLRGRAPAHVGSGLGLGQRAGEERHTLAMAELPQHAHQARASGAPATVGSIGGSGTDVAAVAGASIYGGATGATSLNPGSVSNAGGGQAHENMQPFTVLNFCIALQGIFPSPN